MVPEGWGECRLGEVTEFQRGFDLPKSQRQVGEIPIISSAGYSGWHSTAKVERAGIVTGRYGSIGDVFLVYEDHWPLNTTLWVKDFHGNHIQWAYHLLQTIDYAKFSDKTGVPGINRNDIHRIKVRVPPLPEQRKIAEILGTWDRAIEVAEAQLAAAKTQKRSLMQQLLTGKRRFSEFEGQPWKEVRLGDVGQVITGSTPSTKNEHYYGGPIPFVSPADLDGRTLIYSAQKTLTHEGMSVSRTVPKGATLFSCIGYIGKVGLAGVDLVTNQQINAVVPNSSVDSEYLFYALSAIGPKVKLLAGHNVVPIVNKSEFSLQRITLPPLREQKKIAASLGIADVEVAIFSTNIENLRTEKNALMQQLLTGKRRVSI
ncbi:putative type I restriction-modification system, S subunit [Rhodobacterales bacterium HTCC2150]|nr:putative type I restriction-modification system, S subunit [Rhodobacterales bacterium HTCC2150] [Rhodobacteraceae bacterium HTCC2150]